MNCEFCGKEFEKVRATKRFCSRICKNRQARKDCKKTDLQKLVARVSRHDGDGRISFGPVLADRPVRKAISAIPIPVQKPTWQWLYRK